MSAKPKVRTCLWFDGQGEEAAQFYVSLLPDSRVEQFTRTEDESMLLMKMFASSRLWVTIPSVCPEP